MGFWRLADVFDEFRSPRSWRSTAPPFAAYEPISRVALERGWEFIGHGFTQKNMQKVENEREDIIKTREAIRAFTGRAPRGWLGPGLTETWETPDILAEEGFDYVADWVLDDQPVCLKTRSKPIVGIPYTQECNDVAMMLIQHHAAAEYRNRAIDQFDQLYKDLSDSPESWRWSCIPTSWVCLIGFDISANAAAHAQTQRCPVLDGRTHPRLVPRCRTESVSWIRGG